MKNIILTLFFTLISLQVISGKEPLSYTNFKKISLFKSDRQEIEKKSSMKVLKKFFNITIQIGYTAKRE